MKTKLFFLFFLGIIILPSFGQTIVNAPSINKYANVLQIDYCKNSISVPAGMGAQFAAGNKILIIQMKGASLVEGNNANNGKVDDYNNAGNYEINEIKSINSFANDEIVFKYALERAYNVSGFVQIVNIPQYDDVVFQNTLTCQAWNGSFGGILTFNATGSVTLNADIDVSSKGFRGGDGTTLVLGNTCFGGAGYTGYNCEIGLDCGAKKGEGIGNRYETLDLGRTPNANGGGGANDHNAGGGGGGAFGLGGRGGDISNAGCNGFGAFGGEKLDYNNILNKVFLSGGGGAGDANNGTATSFIGSTGGDAGGMVFISAAKVIANGNKIVSNGEVLVDEVHDDGAGGGGAGGVVLLDINTYTDILNIELNGGNGASVIDGTRCPGPGGGGAGGIVWISQSSTVANITLNANGGVSGTVLLAPCAGSTNNAEVGSEGGFYFNFPSYVSNEIFEPLTLVAGNDTVICGEGVAPLWAEASASNAFDFEWNWGSGSTTEYNFDFDPEFSGNYIVTASAKYTPVYGPECKEIYLVNVDIRKPNISIVASSFFGDTVSVGQPYFVNAVVTPLNPNYIYEWKPAEQVDPNNERNAVAIPYETEEFCLTVTDELGCSNTECVTLYVYEASIVAANAFSPNADGLNDDFFPILSEDLIVESFKVYDRWGDLVYETIENKAWDGNKNGKKLPLDLYIWHIKVKQNLSEKVFEKQGDISIIR